jgi:HEAT repeat protein
MSGDVETLVDALSDEALAPTAAKYLGELRATSAAPELIRTLCADNPYMRAAAAVALGKIGDNTASGRLRELSETDPIPFVRAAALEAALENCEQDALGGLAAKGLQEKHWQSRFVAAQALGRRGGPDDLAALRTARDADVWWRARDLSEGDSAGASPLSDLPSARPTQTARLRQRSGMMLL